MSRKDAMQVLRQRLVIRRSEICGLLKGDLTALRGLLSESGDAVDCAADSAQLELTSALIQAESRELDSIDEALKRYEGEGFGDCENCSVEIPLARLSILPNALLCIECQENYEKIDSSVWPLHLHDA